MAHAAFHGIEDLLATPPATDQAHLREVLDLMAELEITSPTLLALGLKASYGWDLPEQVPDNYPVILHWPAGEGVGFSSLTVAQIAGHPGGKRVHRHLIEICLIIRPRAAAPTKQLMNLSLDWLYALDALYSRNARLGGRAQDCGLRGARPGTQAYGGTSYFGWLFRAEITTNYTV